MCFLILGGFISAEAQNLIPNPGFDEITDCPSGQTGIYSVSLAPPWESAGLTPDLWHECSLPPFQVNDPVSNTPAPRSGGGYAGAACYKGHPTRQITYWGSTEFILTPLIKKLSKNAQYYVEFFIAVQSIPNQAYWCYTDAVGLAFSSEKITLDFPRQPLPSSVVPAIEHSGELLTNTHSWKRISGCYQANGDEKYAILGNFMYENEMLVEISHPDSDIAPYGTYFYFEDVGVWEFDPLPDTVLLCAGETKMYNAAFLNATYRWSDGSTDSTFIISREGVYSVSAIMENCVLSDTMVVIGIASNPLFTSDTLVCEGEKVTLTAPIPGDYYWSTGEQSPSIEIGAAGLFTVNISNECGNFDFETLVETEVCACPIFVPNVFSPNGDGLNDELLVFEACDFPLYINQFRVYDRWGNLVYASVGGAVENIRWNGFLQGRPVSPGVYTWFMEYTIAPKGQPERKIMQGDISILR